MCHCYLLTFVISVYSITYPKHVSEIVAARRQNHLVRLEKFALTRQRHVHKVLVQLEVSEGRDNVPLEVVPLEAEVLVRHHDGLGQPRTTDCLSSCSFVDCFLARWSFNELCRS